MPHGNSFVAVLHPLFTDPTSHRFPSPPMLCLRFVTTCPSALQGGPEPHGPSRGPAAKHPTLSPWPGCVRTDSNDRHVMSGRRLLSYVGSAGGCAHHQTAPAPGPLKVRGSSRAPASHHGPGALRGGERRSQPALRPSAFWKRGPHTTGRAQKAGRLQKPLLLVRIRACMLRRGGSQGRGQLRGLSCQAETGKQYSVMDTPRSLQGRSRTS